VGNISDIEYEEKSNLMKIVIILIIVVTAAIVIFGIIGFESGGEGFNIGINIVCSLLSKLPFGGAAMAVLIDCPSLSG